MKIAFGLEYHGGDFCGWQTQPGGCGVQDVAESALSFVAGTAVKVCAAGRTDAQVHAALQIAHFDSPVHRSPASWMRGANARLPPSVSVLWARPIADDFHARHSALVRRYQYVLVNRPEPPALMHGLAGFCHMSLDIEAMRRAAESLLGQHDFSAFRAAACQAKSPIRRLHQIDARATKEFVVFDFCADGFLHHMARNIVGALLEIGRGRRPPSWMAHVLQGKNRALAAGPAAAGGLYFCGASYPPRFSLPEEFRPPPAVR